MIELGCHGDKQAHKRVKFTSDKTWELTFDPDHRYPEARTGDPCHNEELWNSHTGQKWAGHTTLKIPSPSARPGRAAGPTVFYGDSH